jgi:multicomponent Na+:H+ antiporter subunit E
MEAGVTKTRRGATSTLALALVLTGIWYLLSGKLDLLHFGAGVLAAATIAATLRPVVDGTTFSPARFLVFLPWMVVQIVVSNLRVARMVLRRRMPVEPAFLRETPGVRGTRALAMLGASITLTPGTLTLDVGEDEVFVHALDAASARDVREKAVARRLADVFRVEARP